MKIRELRLLTSALLAQREFYTRTLGLPAVTATPGALTIQAGATQLTFQPALPEWRGVYHFAFNIPENQFAEAKAWVQSRAPLIADRQGADEFDFANWNAHALYVYDPAGNIVEFIARHNLPTASARPFDEHGLLCVSEIGLAANDVPDAVRAIQSTLGAAVYDGAGSESFTAVGDEHGLFIVVKRGRVWFPDTGRAADFLPVTALIEPPHGPPQRWGAPLA